MWNQLTIGYLAGIIEADGSITRNGYKNKDGLGLPLVKVNMVDKDVIENLYKLSGIGRVTGPFHYQTISRPNNQPTYLWTVAKRDDVITLLNAIMPLLGERKHGRAVEALQYLQERMKPVVCELCGISFNDRGPNAKYCSHKHAAKAGRMRRKKVE